VAEQPGLFDVDPAWEDHAGERLSAGRRLTMRQAALLASGWHPLSGGKVHAEAAPADDRTAPGRRCGNCRFRATGEYPKCFYGWDGDRRHAPPRTSRGLATDCRAWWPACQDHEYPTEETPGNLTQCVDGIRDSE
jgi:hypothetical protein